MRLCDISEGELLARVFPVYAGAVPHAWGSVPVGPGDDAAVVGTPGGSVVATTDSMVRGRDWLDEWSSAHDVGVKIAAQNLADVAAMGAVPTALLVSLVADPELEVEWAVDLARGISSLAEQAGAPVVGGDLSSAPPGRGRRLGHRPGRPARPGAGAALGGAARRRRRGLRHARLVRRRAGPAPARRARPRPGPAPGARPAGALGERSSPCAP